MTALRCSETLRKTAPAYERKFGLAGVKRLLTTRSGNPAPAEGVDFEGGIGQRRQ
ncbi:MAG: hypothetical protein ACI8SI_002999 [Congregibacter sp.]|jgi:hypothetical protein